MFRKTVIITLLMMGFCYASSASAAEPNDYIVPGKSYMLEHTLSGLRQAYQVFDAGLNDQNCPQCSTDRELIFLHAVTRTAMLFIDNNDVQIDSFLELAEEFGVMVTGNYFLDFDDLVDPNDLLDVNVVFDANGCYRIPERAPNAVELGEAIRYVIIPEINDIIGELDSINDSPSDRFHIFFEPEQTGLENDLEVDYGEVLILKGLLIAFKSQLEGQLAYDVFVDVDEDIMHSLLYDGYCDVNDATLAALFYINDPNNPSINADFLEKYPDLLKVLPTPGHPDVNGAAILAQSKQGLIDSIDYYFEALDYIMSENIPPGTDPQEDELLYIDPNDRFLLDTINEKLTSLRDSLENDTVATYPLETTKTYNIYDSNSILIGQLVLVYYFTGIEGDAGSLTFTDANLAPSPWEVEWFGREGSDQIEIELEYIANGEWRWGFFEATLSNDNNHITNGTVEYWGWMGSNWVSGKVDGLWGQLVSTEVVEVDVDLNPIFGGTDRYPDPVNPRDILPEFYGKNMPISGTFGHGLGDNPTLGGILPGMTQEEWAILFDLPMTESSFAETALSEALVAQGAVINNIVISGDFDSTLNFTSFEIVTIATGPWAGKGFSKGQWETTLDGIPYEGDWKGILFLKPEERKIYLKGAISGEILATVEGYLIESVPESGIYDQYQATWKIGRLGSTTTSAVIDLDGYLSYQSSSEFPATELYLLQTNIEGTVYGHYSGSLSTVINHVRIADGNNPYDGEGFSIISYVSESGSGQGWTYDRLLSPGRVELKGLFSSPLFGIVSGILDESELPRTLSLRVDRVDLGLPPMADLEVKTWGPGRVSPGQTVNYIIEYRNDGLRSAENVVVVSQLPPEVEYISSTNEGIYKWQTHEVIWKRGTLLPKDKENLAVTVRVEWGLPWGTQLINDARIDTTSDEIDKYLNPDVAIYNIQYYLDYRPVEIDSTETLSPEELSEELKDEGFKALFDLSQEAGFIYLDTAARIDFSDGSFSIVVPMASAQEMEFVVKSSHANLSYIMNINEATFSVFNETDGFLYDNNTGNVFLWGEHYSCNWAECVNHCLAKKLGRYLGSQALSALTKRVSNVLLFSYHCSSMFTRPLEERYKYFEQCVKDIPGVGELAELTECMAQCAGDVYSHGCRDDDYCYKCLSPFWTGINGFKKLVCKDCLWESVLFGGMKCPEGTRCNQVDRCRAKCVPEDDNSDSADSEVQVARDPSVKYGPEGRVSPSQGLNYKVEYENEGEGIAFGVYFTDTLDEDLGDSTLKIGPVIDVNDGSIISGAGIYNPATRTITWFAGEVGPSQGGYTEFSVNVSSDANDGTEIINFATIYFPSVPEETRTNGIVSIVSLYQPQPPVIVQEALDIVNGFAPEVFKKTKDQKKITKELNSVIDKLEKGKAKDQEKALKKLEKLIKKMDGCALKGYPDKKDSIIDCDAQAAIYPLLLDVIELLKQ